MTYHTIENSILLNNNKSVFFYSSNVIIYFLAVASIFSPIRIIPYFNVFSAVLVFLWFVLTTLDNPKFLFSPSVHHFAIFVFISYTIIFPYLMGNEVISNRFWGLAQIPVFYLAYQNNKKKKKQKFNFQIILFTLPFIIITSLITINAYTLDPFISRKIKKTELGYLYMEQGIGGYEFIYFLVICTVILLYIVFNKNLKLSKTLRFIVSILLILFSANIVLSNYSIALFLLLISFVVKLFISARISKRKIYFTLLIFLVLLFITQLFIIDILDLLIEFSGNSLNASRFLELKQYFLESRISDTIESRIDHWLDSIISFWNYPILGIIQTELKYSGGFLIGFGQHSQILDVFALFGLGIGILQIYIFSQPLNARLKNIDNSYSGLSIHLFIIFFILFTINNVTQSIGFALYFIYPTVYDWKQRLLIKTT